MTIDTTKLRELAQAAEGYGSCKYAWPHDEHDGVAVVGQIHDGEKYPVAEIDTGQYFANEEAIKLAGFYAAANPATVLALLDELDRLRKVESATLQGEKIGCRCTYTDNQTVDTERLYHRAIRSERDRLRAELTAMREDLNDAAQCIARQRQTIRRLQDIEAAARNLAKVKGRHHSEQAMNQLLEALK